MAQPCVATPTMAGVSYMSLLILLVLNSNLMNGKSKKNIFI